MSEYIKYEDYNKLLIRLTDVEERLQRLEERKQNTGIAISNQRYKDKFDEITKNREKGVR